MVCRLDESIAVLVATQDARPIPKVKVDLYHVDGMSHAIEKAGTWISQQDGRISIPIPPAPIMEDRGPQMIGMNYWLLVSHLEDEFDLAGVYASDYEHERGIVWTDRPVYAPGETVHFQVLSLRGHAQAWVPTTRERINVTAFSYPRAGEAQARWDTVLTTNELGVAAGSLINPATAPGMFGMRVVTRGDFYLWDESIKLAIREFRTTDCDVSARLLNGEAILGDTVSVSVTARSPQGLPLGGRSITCTVERVTMFRRFRIPNERVSQGWYGRDLGQVAADSEEGTPLATLQCELDASGQAILRIPTEPPKPGTTRTDYTLNGLTLSIAIAGSEQMATLEVPLFPGRAWCTHTTGHFGQPLLPGPGSMPVPIVRADNLNRTAPGPVYYRWIGQSAEPSSVLAQGRTETLGNGVAYLAPPPGTTPRALDVWAGADDRFVTRISARAESIEPGDCVGERAWIASDRVQYSIGETARLTLSSQIRSQAGILWCGVRRGWFPLRLLPGGDSTITVRVQKEHIPMASLLWTSAEDTEEENPFRFDSGITGRIVVDPKSRFLSLAITTDRQNYAPGDSMVVQVRAVDPEGRPVTAAITVQAVDEAIYASLPDIDLLRHFYWLPREDGGFMTGCSWGPPPAGPPVFAARQPTAFWASSLRTDTSGRASLRVKLPNDSARWRITARAVDAKGRLGEALHSFRTHGAD